MADYTKLILTSFPVIIGVSLSFLALNFHASQSDSEFWWWLYNPMGDRGSPGGIGQHISETHKGDMSAESKVGGDALHSDNVQTKKCTKHVQYWPGPKMFLPDGEYVCPDENITVIFKSERSYDALSTSDAVILHQTGNWKIADLIRLRPKGQMWIYMSWESPHHSLHGRVPNVFNWTMTYRTDSEFSFGSPYGSYKEYDSVTKTENLIKNKDINWAENKTKLSAWISSKCKLNFYLDWPRTLFVKGLSKKMSIDMFGKCGDKSCPKDGSCFEKLRSYKFYLAFENSCCTDYITEKTWRNAFMYDTVPIVYGTNKRNYEKLAPPNSFIHVNDFPNVTSLVNYIKLLDSDDSLYNTFFRWKNFGYTKLNEEEEVITKEKLCSMAKLLCSDPPQPITVDINKEWFDTCHDPPPLPLPV